MAVSLTMLLLKLLLLQLLLLMEEWHHRGLLRLHPSTHRDHVRWGGALRDDDSHVLDVGRRLRPVHDVHRVPEVIRNRNHVLVLVDQQCDQMLK